jgi:hypothetical protein
MKKPTSKYVLAAVLLAGGSISAAFGQLHRETPPRLTLRQTTRPAGYIFAGRVSAIEFQKPQSPDEVATVRVTFQVEQAIRGTRSGASLTIREWAGSWNAGVRYRVGERLVLFLYPPSKLGLTSPVGGQHGRFLLDPEGHVVLGRERSAMIEDAVNTSPGSRTRISLDDFTRAVRRTESAEE